MNRRELTTGLLASAAGALLPRAAAAQRAVRRLLYVANPGVRNYVEYGGVGVCVYDVDDNHRWLRRIPTPEIATGDAPENVKGLCASARTGKLYVSSIKRLVCIDLATEKVDWAKTYEGGCDRMAITPDGQTIYMPSLEGPHWHVLDALSGDVKKKLVPDSGAHNTLCSIDGRYAYLAGLKSPLLRVVDTRTNEIVREVGPFGNVIRPFTVNGSATLAYINANDLLGFEVGDLRTGKMLHRVEVQGYNKGPVKRHGCPSHGVGLTPDEREVWLTDAHNERLHLFDNTQMPPKPITSIKVRDQPGWITFSLDGRRAYPSTGEVIDTRTKQVITTLKDEEGRAVQSEKMLEILTRDGKPVQNGDQFGIGRKR
jgi:DNA-binding beta-propeller fold protein YncE